MVVGVWIRVKLRVYFLLGLKLPVFSVLVFKTLLTACSERIQTFYEIIQLIHITLITNFLNT
jgi:hypothetical protein